MVTLTRYLAVGKSVLNVPKLFKVNDKNIKPFQPSVAFHIETSHLFCRAKQMTGFYVKRNYGLKWVNPFQTNVSFLHPSENLRKPEVKRVNPLKASVVLI